MRVLEFSDAHHFLERTRSFLFKTEVVNNLILSSALALSKSHSRSTLPARALTFLAALDQKDNVAGAALRTPQHRWMISAASLDPDGLTGSRKLAHAIANRAVSQRLRSLMLPSDTVDSFLSSADEFGELERATTSNFMSVTELRATDRAASGLMRLAQPKDLKKLMQWSQLSAVEGGLDESPDEAAQMIQKYIDHRQLYVWDNNGRTTAMAAIGGFTPRVTRISHVYTDRAARGHGYATTLVHRLTHRQLTEETPTCVLFADAKNSTTKHIYEKLGYTTIQTYSELRKCKLARSYAGNAVLSVTTTG